MASTDLSVKAHTLPALLDLCAKEHNEEIFMVFHLITCFHRHPIVSSLILLKQLCHDKKFNQHTVTFGQFRSRVIKAALHLRAAGVDKGSRCAVLFDISESAITNILAITSLGAVAVLANRQIPPHILSQMFKRYSKIILEYIF
jgi:hypothetical protein